LLAENTRSLRQLPGITPPLIREDRVVGCASDDASIGQLQVNKNRCLGNSAGFDEAELDTLAAQDAAEQTVTKKSTEPHSNE